MKLRWILLLALLGAAIVAGNVLPASAGALPCMTCEEEPPIEEEFDQPPTITINGIGAIKRGTAVYCESTIIGWSGDCSGTGSCSVTMDEPRAVTATFSDVTPPAAPTITSPRARRSTSRSAPAGCRR